MTDSKATIFYTLTDEAPALATRSLLPILQAFAATCGIDIKTKNISLAHRILATFADYLKEDQRVPDALAELAELVLEPHANIVKTPNISASIPQIKAAVKELQENGFDLPEFPDEPKDEEQEKVRALYEMVKGSNVNPVIREGNSDRRAPVAVKKICSEESTFNGRMDCRFQVTYCHHEWR